MKKEDVVVGAIVYHLRDARSHIQSIGDIKHSSQIVEEGTDWRRQGEGYGRSRIPGDEFGVMIKALPCEHFNLYSHPSAWELSDLCTLEEFLERCRELKAEEKEKRERDRALTELTNSYTTRFKAMGFNMTVACSSTTHHPSLGTIESLLTELEGHRERDRVAYSLGPGH